MPSGEFRDVFLAVAVKPGPVDFLKDGIVSAVLLSEQYNEDDGSPALETESCRPLVCGSRPAEEINEKRFLRPALVAKNEDGFFSLKGLEHFPDGRAHRYGRNVEPAPLCVDDVVDFPVALQLHNRRVNPSQAKGKTGDQKLPAAEMGRKQNDPLALIAGTVRNFGVHQMDQPGEFFLVSLAGPEHLHKRDPVVLERTASDGTDLVRALFRKCVHEIIQGNAPAGDIQCVGEGTQKPAQALCRRVRKQTRQPLDSPEQGIFDGLFHAGTIEASDTAAR